LLNSQSSFGLNLLLLATCRWAFKYFHKMALYSAKLK
jgi:hypothetical protein